MQLRTKTLQIVLVGAVKVVVLYFLIALIADYMEVSRTYLYAWILTIFAYDVVIKMKIVGDEER